jgi:hypothetical protein
LHTRGSSFLEKSTSSGDDGLVEDSFAEASQHSALVRDAAQYAGLRDVSKLQIQHAPVCHRDVFGNTPNALFATGNREKRKRVELAQLTKHTGQGGKAVRAVEQSLEAVLSAEWIPLSAVERQDDHGGGVAPEAPHLAENVAVHPLNIRSVLTMSSHEGYESMSY